MSAVEEILEKLKTLSLLEAAELVKGIEETFGVSAAASAGVPTTENLLDSPRTEAYSSEFVLEYCLSSTPSSGTE